MKRIRIGVLAACCAFVGAVSAVGETETAGGWTWYEKDALQVRGRGFSDVDTYYCRLPVRAKDTVRTPIWEKAHDSTGFFVRFRTSAPRMRLEWAVSNEDVYDAYIPPAGLLGFDIYRKTSDGWDYVGNKRYRPKGVPGEKTGVAEFDWTPGEEGLLLLPIRAKLTSFRVGVPAGSRFETVGFPRGHERPVVHYGTSIVHGGCASRAGLAFTSIAQRELDRDYINLGFAGDGQMEVELAPFMAEIDAAIYVVDCAWNMTPEKVHRNAAKFLRELRRLKPDTPILLCEGCNSKERRLEINDEIRKVYDALKQEDPKAWNKLYYFPEEEMLVKGDLEQTHDFCHPNDFGMRAMGAAYAKRIREVLTK